MKYYITIKKPWKKIISKTLNNLNILLTIWDEYVFIISSINVNKRIKVLVKNLKAFLATTQVWNLFCKYTFELVALKCFLAGGC